MQKNKIITLLSFCVIILLKQDLIDATNLDLIQINTATSNSSIVKPYLNLSIPEHRHTLSFRDPKIISVNIQLQPAHYLEDIAYVSTSDNLTATAEVDERFKNLTLTYQWSTRNETIITDSNATKIVYRFSRPDENNFLKVLVVHRPDDTGSKQKNLVVRDPISMPTPIGKLFLEHGELLKITIRFNGTGPFTYCYQFCRQDIDNGNCDCQLDYSHHLFTISNEVNITKYLRNVGNYTLLFAVDNIVSRVVKPYSIKIIDTIRKHTTSYVPIVCSISAVFILLTGLVLHLQFKRTVHIETADFDFTRQDFEDEGWDDEEQSFFQRIRYILRAERESNQSTWINTSLNSSRTRLIPS